MGREARAKVTAQATVAAEQRQAGTRIKLDELDWFKLQAAHGAIFRTQDAARQKLAALQQELQRVVKAEQDAFDALVKKLGKQYKFDATKATRWDNETQEIIQD